MNATRYITIQAILTEDGELIPLWDSRIKFEKSDYYGDYYELDGSHKMYNPIECIFDTKDKKISGGLELNYDDVNEIYNVGDVVLYETSHHVLSEKTIVDIVYKNFSTTIKKGKKLDNYITVNFPDVIIEPNTIYIVKCYTPTFILNDGKEVDLTYSFYKLKKD